jgi:hypothetical protein
MRSIDARESLSSSVRVEHESRDVAPIVLIERRPLMRQCLSRWLQGGSPELHASSARRTCSVALAPIQAYPVLTHDH